MLSDIKKYIKESSAYPLLKSFRNMIKKRHPLQKISNQVGYKYSRLGTNYGGWTYVDEPYLYNSVIISAGLGEDASFDVEFATKYNATVIIIDPTPRAIKHFEGIEKRIGKKNDITMSDFSGKLPVECYDLSNVNRSQLKFLDKAIWNETTSLKFYAPSNSDHVSHSIVNFQNNYSNKTSYIEVEACTITDLIMFFEIDPVNIPLIKLDIEGAEIEVIESLISSNIRPRQLLVEYDELNSPSDISYNRVTEAHTLLTANNYKCIFTDRQSDFLYILNT